MTCVFCFSVTCGLLVPRVRFSETLCAAHFLSAAVSLLRTIPSLSFFDELACLAGEQYTEMKKLARMSVPEYLWPLTPPTQLWCFLDGVFDP